MAIDLSNKTIEILESVFASSDRENAAKILRECADDLPLWHDVSPEGLERIRFAALKLSEGKIAKLEAAVELAHIDWRDALVTSGFGNDPRAHLEWRPAENEPS